MRKPTLNTFKTRNKKLITALNSDNYLQGDNQLYDPNTKCFCVLGVAIDVYCKDKSIPSISEDLTTEQRNKLTDGPSERPSELVASYYGWKQIDPVVTVKESQYKLSELNDSGNTFKEIAKIIKSNLNNLIGNINVTKTAPKQASENQEQQANNTKRKKRTTKTKPRKRKVESTSE